MNTYFGLFVTTNDKPCLVFRFKSIAEGVKIYWEGMIENYKFEIKPMTEVEANVYASLIR